MNQRDVLKFRSLLKGVNVIDIISFGSAVSPEYLISLLSEASWNGRVSNRYGFVSSSLPGNGWYGGFNTLLASKNVDWVIGGFFGTVERINMCIENNEVEVHNVPQGIVSQLLTQSDRTMSTRIGNSTFLDPNIKGTLVNDKGSACLNVSKRVDGLINYNLPDSDLVLVRGEGTTTDGEIVLETNPIDLDIELCIRAAKARGAKVVIQIPNKIIKKPNVTCSYDLFDGVFVSPKSLHKISFLPTRYHQQTDNLTRQCDVTKRIAKKLYKRIEQDESLIIGIGLPVPAINHISTFNVQKSFTPYIESGRTGEVLYDGDGFGYSKNGKSVYSQSQIFNQIWNGGIDHAVLGVGDVDLNGNVHVASLGGKFYGVGGFVDISQSVSKLTFCQRKKEPKNLTDLSYAFNTNQDIRFIVG